MIRISIATDLTLSVAQGSLPPLYSSYREHAVLVDEFDLDDLGAEISFVAVGRSWGDWPFLVVAQRYSPGGSGGFFPGILWVPETGRLFVGAGERILCYDLATVRRLWEDEADTGFWFWTRHGDFVLMSAELELAGWGIDGEKLWTTLVEPPWGYEVRAGMVQLDVMGRSSAFPIATGPPAAR